jgi:serine/threonine protein kinase
MDVCPSCSELEQFLSDRLAPERDSRVLTHVETCSMCQQVLEAMTACTSAESGHSVAIATHPARPATKPAMPRQIGQYTLIRELGQGGMGVVYLAEQATLKRLVALKVIRHGINASSA